MNVYQEFFQLAEGSSEVCVYKLAGPTDYWAIAIDGDDPVQAPTLAEAIAKCRP